MRKSFTRLLGLSVLMLAISAMSFAQGITYSLSPGDGDTNVDPRGLEFSVTFDDATEVEIEPQEEGIIGLYDDSGVQLKTIQVTSSQNKVGIAGNVVTIDFGYDFKTHQEESFFITIEDNVFVVDDEGFPGLNINSVSPMDTDWDFTIGDYTGSDVTLFPPDNSDHAGWNGPGIEIATDLKLTFDDEDDVYVVDGKKVALYKENGNLVAYMLIEEGTNTNVTGNTVTFETEYADNSAFELEEEENYYVRVEEGAITDGSGNSVGVYLGQNDNTSWNFTAADNTRPTVEGAIDIDKDLVVGTPATDVSQNPVIVLEFNEELYREPTGTEEGLQPITDSNLASFIQVRVDGGGSLISSTKTINDNTVTVTVTDDLASFTDYEVVINSPVYAKDDEYNPVLPTEYDFTTGDFNRPEISNIAVARTNDTTQKIDITVDVTDDSNIGDGDSDENATIKFMVVDAGADAPSAQDILDDGETLEFVAGAAGLTSSYKFDGYENSSMASDATIDIYFAAIDDATTLSGTNQSADEGDTSVGDEYEVKSRTGFYLTDTEAPTVTLSYSNEVGTKVGRDADFILTFDDLVEFDTADYSVEDSEDNAVTITDPATQITHAVNGDGNSVVTITIDDQNSYATNASLETYTIIVDGDLTDDLTDKVNGGSDTQNGTANAIGDDDVELTAVQVEDYEGPVVVEFNPADGDGSGLSTAVDTDGLAPTIEFSEVPCDVNGVALTSSDLEKLIRIQGDSITSVPFGDIPSDYDVTIDGTVVTIEMNEDFEWVSESEYTVSIEETIYDENGFQLLMYDDNTTSIDGYSYPDDATATFEVEDIDEPTVTFSTSAPGGSMMNVPVDATVFITFDEEVYEKVGDDVVAIDFTGADDNMIRSLITLTDYKGDDIEFDLVDITASGTPMETVVEIDPIDYPTTYEFTKSKTYTVSVDGIADDNGNDVSGSDTFTIVEAPESGDMVVEVSIKDGDILELDETTIVLNFEEAVTPQTGFTLDVVSDGAGGTENLDVTSPTSIGSGGLTYTYTLTAGTLDSDAEYTLDVAVGAFESQVTGDTKQWPNGSAFSIEYTTVDGINPDIDIYGGVAATTGAYDVGNDRMEDVGIDDEIELTFDENVHLSGNGQIRILDPNALPTENEIVYVYTGGSDGVTDDDPATTDITLDLSYASLEYNKVYNLEISENYIVDKANNLFTYNGGTSGGILGSTFQFVTAENEAPEYVSSEFVPEIGADDVEVGGTTVTIAFDESAALATSGSAFINLNKQVGGTPAPGDAVMAFNMLDPENTERIEFNEDRDAVTIDFDSISGFTGFEANSDYYVTLHDMAAAFIDDDLMSNGSELPVTTDEDGIWTNTAGYSVASTWYFTTTDNTDPVAEKLLADDVSVSLSSIVQDDATLKVQFDEDVSLASTYDYSDAFTIGVTAGAAPGIDNANCSIDENIVTLALDDDFDATALDATVVTVTVEAGHIADTSPAANTNVETEFQFTLEDLKTPVVSVVAYDYTFDDAGYEISPLGGKANVEITTDEAATVTLTIVEAGDDPDVVANVVKTQEVAYDAAVTSKIDTINGLDELTKYDVYAFAVDASANANESEDDLSTTTEATIATSDVTNPTVVETYPLDPTAGEVIPMYVERYGNTVTPLKITFSEEIIEKTTPVFWVRDMETNEDVAIDISAPSVNPDDASLYDVTIVPASGAAWTPGDYYLESNYDQYADNPAWGAANDYEEAYYGKDEFKFTVAEANVAPELVETNTSADPATYAIMPLDGATVDGNKNIKLTINYTQPVSLDEATGFIEVYKAEFFGTPNAPAQEIIAVDGNVELSTDEKVVTVDLANALRSDKKERYVIVLPANMVVDKYYNEDDATTTADLTPFTGLTQDAGGADIDENLGDEGDGVWDIYSVDEFNPMYTWTSDWVDVFDHTYGYNTKDNFPHSDAAADHEDWLDVGIGDGNPTREIYIEFTEEMFIDDAGTALTDGSGSTVDNFDPSSITFTFINEDEEVEDVPFSADYDLGTNIITINPTVDFKSETEYTVSIKDDEYFDVDGNDLQSLGDEVDYVFTTWLAASPTVEFAVTPSTLNEEDRSTLLPVITATFSEGIRLESNYQALVDVDIKKFFVLHEKGTLATVANAIDYNVVGDSTNYVDEFAIQPVDSLNPEKEYIFEVLNFDIDGDTKTLVDDVRVQTMNGNVFNQAFDDRHIEFMTEDNVTPKLALAAFDPAHEDYNVAPDHNSNKVTVTFDEDVVPVEGATGLIEIRRVYVYGAKSKASGSLFQAFNVDDVTFDGADLVLPIDTLDEFQGYTVIIPEGFVADKAGNEYVGLEENDWIFATDDGTAPLIESAYPAIEGDPINFPTNADFELTFDENIEIGSGNFVLYQLDEYHIENGIQDGNVFEVIEASDVVVSGTDPINDLDANVITIPHMVLDSGVHYYIRYDEGVVNDGIAGNDIAERYDYSWNFTTSEHSGPGLAFDGLDPMNEEVGQEPVLTMTFDDTIPVEIGSGFIRIYEYYYSEGGSWNSRLESTIDVETDQVSRDGNVITIDPDMKLQDNIDKYYVLVDESVITNQTTGDFWDGIADHTRWFFSTVPDDTAPVLDTVTTNVACGVAPGEITATIELTDFNGIAAGTGNFEVYYAADSTLAFEVPASDARVEFVNDSTEFDYIEKSTATITFDAADLEEETDYYVMVGENAIFDNSNADVPNVFDGSVVSDWSFSVNDFTAPYAMLDMDTNFTASDSLVVTLKFNEEVQVGSAPDFVVATAADSVEAFSYTITEANINNDDSTVTVVVNGLDDMTDYYMAYDSSFVNDMAYAECLDVRAAEAIDANTWKFNTGDNTAPTASIVSPQLAQTADTVLVVEFSEPVNVVDLEGYAVVDGDSVLLTSTDSITYSGIITELPSEATVEVVFPDGSFNDSIVGGTTNSIDQGTVLTFEVDDISAPVAQYMPNGIYEEYYKEVELRMAFDDNVTDEDKNVYLVEEETGDTIQIIGVADFDSSNGDSIYSYTTDLPGYGSYYVLADYGAFVDNEAATVGQNYEGITDSTVWAFDVVDNEFENCAAIISPERGEQEVATTTTISLSFDCEEGIYPPVREGRYISIGDQAEEQVEGVNYFNIEVADSMIDGTTLTLEVSGLKENTTYSITVAEGAVTDEAENEFIGISNANDWIFKTGDFTAPVATLVAGTSIEGEDAEATMTSSENGTLYLVEEGVTADVAVMEAAIDDNKAAKVPAIADTDAMVDVSSLVAGTYNAVAVDIFGNVGVKTDDAYVIDEAPSYPELTIAEIQGTGDETPYADQIVVTSGTVTGVDEDGAGFFMQDTDDSPRSGIYVNDSDLAGQVNIGSNVTVTGTASENGGLTQIGDLISELTEFTSTVANPVKAEITASEMGEDYESVLVRIESLKTTSTLDANDEWMTKDTENDVDVKIDNQLYTYQPDAGQRYHIAGVCNYSDDEFKLAPRMDDDVEFVSGIDMLDINIDIYPNPFDTYVKFDVSRDVEITKAVITNIAGQLVKQVDYPENTIRTDELRSGVYFISLQTEEGIAKTERIIKR